MAADPAASQEPRPPETSPEPRATSTFAYAGYYLLLFFAYWFGSSRFDADGDGDFDPEDVQTFLANMGLVTRNFQKTGKPKRRGGAAHEAGEGDDRELTAHGTSRPPCASGASLFSLDQNGDGTVDPSDFYESQVVGQSVEEYVKEQQRWPVFIVGQSLLAFLLWLGGSIHNASQGGAFLSSKAGLDTFSPGWSDLRLSGPLCQDWRGEVWRNLTYQWTHVGVSHILMNCFMNLILGIPLEGLHGFCRIFAMYNVGVFGGAICYWVGDAHKHVVGMSGGCYALIGIHLAALVLNWGQMKFRRPILFFLIVLVIVDVVSYVLALGSNNASHTAHIGGALMGLLFGVVVGKNLVVKKFERRVQIICLAVGCVWLLFCIIWMASHSPPKNITESSGYCWVRQIWNPARFQSSQWVCVKCGDKECIARYASETYMETVSLSACTHFVAG
mmetsp:Transcript_96303/g.300664  ORF Transcript_96303/g.300664 Transcript_96303/m.300664 type:complete len:445 (-) Transcript_96303:153-1487(-)